MDTFKDKQREEVFIRLSDSAGLVIKMGKKDTYLDLGNINLDKPFEHEVVPTNCQKIRERVKNVVGTIVNAL